MTDRPSRLWVRILLATSGGDAAVFALIHYLLEQAGFVITHPQTLTQVRVFINAQVPDLIVLQTGSMDCQVRALVEQVRQVTHAPMVIVDEAGASDQEIATLFEAGLDDYITVPFRQKEFVARLNMLARRGWAGGGVGRHISIGPLVLDTARIVLSNGHRSVRLTPIQYKLLAALVQRPGAVLTHDALIRAAWGSPHHASEDALRVAIKRLRARVEAVTAGKGPAIVALPGLGYYFDVPQEGGKHRWVRT